MSSSSDSQENQGFSSLGLSPELLETLTSLGYEEPTPIQIAAIPVVLAGRDIIGQAATGTGKTAAFALPMIQRIATLGKSRPQPSALVLVPTRELAMQVAEAIHKYGNRLGVRALPVYGGQSYEQQVRALKRGVDIVIATPGRARDHLAQGTLDISKVSCLVLDEADEMLDMGFLEDIDAILNETPPDRQVVLFSATLPPRIANVAKRYMKSPEKIAIARDALAPGEMPKIRQTAYVVTRQQKGLALARLLDLEAPTSAIIFCRTRHEVDELTDRLAAHGHSVEPLHGGMNQAQREKVIRRLREAKVELIVATDVAARGLNIEQLSHVFNFDVPSAPEAYVHRIGRVGRAGREGVAITLAEPRETRYLRNLEYVTKQRIEVGKLPTVADLRAKRLDMTKVIIREALVGGELDNFRAVFESLSSDHDIVEIALAAIKVAHEATRSSSDQGEELNQPMAPGTPRRQEPRQNTGPMARLHLNVGRTAGIRPQDLVGAIAGEANINGRQIGAIDIADKFTVVEIEEGVAEQVIEALKHATIKGLKVTARRFVAAAGPAGDADDAPPARSEAPSRGPPRGARPGAPKGPPRAGPRGAAAAGKSRPPRGR